MISVRIVSLVSGPGSEDTETTDQILPKRDVDPQACFEAAKILYPKWTEISVTVTKDRK